MNFAGFEYGLKPVPFKLSYYRFMYWLKPEPFKLS